MPLFWSPPDVERLKAKGNIKGLIKALRYKKESIREAAAEALGQLRARRAVTPLITTFRGAEEYYNVRQAAAIVLSQIGGPQAIGGLIAALQGQRLRSSGWMRSTAHPSWTSSRTNRSLTLRLYTRWSVPRDAATRDCTDRWSRWRQIDPPGGAAA